GNNARSAGRQRLDRQHHHLHHRSVGNTHRDGATPADRRAGADELAVVICDGRMAMVDETRRKILKTGAAAAAMAAVPPVLAQQANPAATGGTFYERGKVRIHYQEWGSGFPLLLISGGGLGGSSIAGLTNQFDTVGEVKGEDRC